MRQAIELTLYSVAEMLSWASNGINQQNEVFNYDRQFINLPETTGLLPPAVWSSMCIDELDLREHKTVDYPIDAMVVIPELDPYLQSLTMTSALSSAVVIIHLCL